MAALTKVSSLADFAAPSQGSKEILPKSFTWASAPPTDCPFEQSIDIAGIEFTGRHAEYGEADTWYLSWASDDKMYSPYMDGSVQDSAGKQASHKASGVAVAEGHNPLDLSVTAISPAKPKSGSIFEQGFSPDSQLAFNGWRDGGIIMGSATYETGLYACANLYYNDIWYVGAETRGAFLIKLPNGKPCDSRVQGPFAFFRYSTDKGRSWNTAPHVPFEMLRGIGPNRIPLFPEPEYSMQPVKMPVPHFLDFGKNMEYSPDGKAYLISHGGTDSSFSKKRCGYLGWNMGDQAYMARVKPNIATINRVEAYEFFAGLDLAGEPQWSGKFSDLRPVFEWKGHTGCITITYNKPLEKYLCCVGDGFYAEGTGPSNLYILESDKLTGPFRLVTYMEHFGPQAYFGNFPSKFINEDGKTLWLCYSANYMNWELGGKPNPEGSKYALCLQEVRLHGSAAA
jgi:hypothetical protein